MGSRYYEQMRGGQGPRVGSRQERVFLQRSDDAPDESGDAPVESGGPWVESDGRGGLIMRIGRIPINLAGWAIQTILGVLGFSGLIIFAGILGMLIYQTIEANNTNNKVNDIHHKMGFVVQEGEFHADDDDDAFPDPHPDDAEDDGWGTHGRDLTNTRHAKPLRLNPTTAHFLAREWAFETEVSPHARPFVPPEAPPPFLKRTVHRDGEGNVLRAEEHPEAYEEWKAHRAQRSHVDDFSFVTGTCAGSVEMTPSWHENEAYFSALDGNLYSIDVDTHETNWKSYVPDFFPELPDTYISETTPVFWSADDDDDDEGDDDEDDDDTHYLIIGTSLTEARGFDIAEDQPTAAGAYVLKVNADTGALVAKLRVDDHPLAHITVSGSRWGDWFFVGVSSFERTAAVVSSYPCCSFVGSFVSVDLRPGGDHTALGLRWKDDTIAPDRVMEGFAGAGVTGSSPSIDRHALCDDDECDGAVFFTTDTLSMVPPDASTCLDTFGHFDPQCDQAFPGAWSNTVHRLNARTGAVEARRKLGVWGLDPWNTACLLENGGTAHPNCNFTFGPNYGFSVAPMLTEIGNDNRDVVLVGQRSGQVWALERDLEVIVWERSIVENGGISGGMCTDGHQIFVPILNTGGGNTGNDRFDGTTGNPRRFGLAFPDYKVVTGGGIAVLDADNGRVLAEKPIPHALFEHTPPNYEAYRHIRNCECFEDDDDADDDDGQDDWGAIDDDDFGLGDCVCRDSILTTDVGLGPATPGVPSCVDGLVFVGGGDRNGAMYAMDARDMEVVWKTSTGGSVRSGPSIVDNCLLFGSGSRTSQGYTENNKVFKYCLSDDDDDHDP